MSQTAPVNQNSISGSSVAKKGQLLLSALLGITILMIVGFAPKEAVHNATHDTAQVFLVIN